MAQERRATPLKWLQNPDFPGSARRHVLSLGVNLLLFQAMPRFYHAAPRDGGRFARANFFAEGSLSEAIEGRRGLRRASKTRERVCPAPAPPHASSTATPGRGAKAPGRARGASLGFFTHAGSLRHPSPGHRRPKTRAGARARRCFARLRHGSCPPEAVHRSRALSGAAMPRSDRRSANRPNPQLRASSDATAHVGDWSAIEGSGADHRWWRSTGRVEHLRLGGEAMSCAKAVVLLID